MNRPASEKTILRPVLTAIGAFAVFIVLATANAGGYRYGASDQAFYVPAIAMTADPTLFPRDRALIEPQMHLWLGDSLFASLTTVAGTLPRVFAGMYLLTLLVLFAGAVALARAFGGDLVTVSAFLALLTLKHQITRTGVNSLEGYGHPRMFAFALGIAALALFLKRRRVGAAAAVVLAGVVHVTTALWFGVAIAVAILWNAPRRIAVTVGALGLALAVIGLTFTSLGVRLLPMDAVWMQAIGDRSYLFSGQWPPVVWMLNLGYALALVAIHRRRRSVDAAVREEAALVAGLMALVLLFLVSVPLAEARMALAVQLQVNRIFWLLDAVVSFYLAWWLVSDLGRAKGQRLRWAIVAVVVAASAARGLYLTYVAPARPLVELDLARSDWTDAMRWLRSQPQQWHVLADPQHVVRFGSSVRVAALRDTLLEAGKDPAMAIYDRNVATRVNDRAAAMSNFDNFTTDDVRQLAARYNLDVFVARANRPFELPVLYRNDGFIAYDLR